MPSLNPIALCALAAIAVAAPISVDIPEAANTTVTTKPGPSQAVVPVNRSWRPTSGKNITFPAAPMRRYVLNATATTTQAADQGSGRLPFWPPIFREPPTQHRRNESMSTTEPTPAATDTASVESKRWPPYMPRPFPGHEAFLPPSPARRSGPLKSFEEEYVVDKSGGVMDKRWPPFMPEPFPAHEVFLPPSGRRGESNQTVASSQSAEVKPSVTLAQSEASLPSATATATSSVASLVLGAEDVMITPSPQYETTLDSDEATHHQARQLLYSSYDLPPEFAWVTECAGCQ